MTGMNGMNGRVNLGETVGEWRLMAVVAATVVLVVVFLGRVVVVVVFRGRVVMAVLGKDKQKRRK